MAGNNRSYSDLGTANDPDKSMNSIDLKTAVISGTFEGLSKEEIDTFYMQNVQNMVDVSVGKGITPKPKERKKGSFQITSVTSGSHLSDPKDDGGDDSQDDLDDTHTFTEETLDNTDYERSPISEHDMNIQHFSDGHTIHRPQPRVADSTPAVAVRERSSTDNQSRFRVVKIVTQEPFRRGRWTCFDSLPQANKPNPETVALDLRENIVVTTGSDTSSAASSIHYVHGQDEASKNPVASLSTQTLTSPIYFDVDHSRYVGHNGVDVAYDHQEYLSQGGRLSDSIHPNGVVHFNGNTGTQQQQSMPTLHTGPQQSGQHGNHLPNVSTVVTNQTTHTGLPSHQGPSVNTQQGYTVSGVPVTTTELPKIPATIGHTAVPNSLMNQPNLHQTLNYQNAAPVVQQSSKIQQSSIPIQQGTIPLQQGSMPVHQSSKPIHQGSVPMQQGAGAMLQNTKPIQQGGMSHTQGAVPKQSVSAQVGAEQYAAPLAIHISDQPSTNRPSATSPRLHDLNRVPRTSRYSISGDEFALAENDLAETSALLEQITNVPTSLSSPSKDNEESSSNAVAIDNKIEQAMDLVKSHLMFAVREEVEVMREQIAELEDQKRLLELENSILRAAASAETLAQVAHAQHNQSMSNT